MDKKIERKKGLRLKHILWLVGTIAFIAFGVNIFKQSGMSVYKADKDKLTLSEVSYGQFKDYIRLQGAVEPLTTFYLDVEEGGKVEEILIEEGEMLNEGDVILRLRNNDLKLSIMNSESSLAYQTNELRNTLIAMEQRKIQNKQDLLRLEYDTVQLKRSYYQNKTLIEQNLVAEEDFLRSKEAVEQAVKNAALVKERLIQDSIFRANQKQQMEAHLHNMQNNLSIIRQRLDNLNVKAPITGQLGLLSPEIGQSVSRGQNIGLINDLTAYKVTAMVDEHYIDRVVKGLKASFERNTNEFRLITKKVYPDVRDGTFQLDFIFEGEFPDNIRTGQTYHVSLELGKAQEAILIPRGGFFNSTGGQWVYVVSDDGSNAVKRSIRIGRQNPNFYEVLEGLNAGEQVITSGYEVFGDNDKIVFK